MSRQRIIQLAKAQFLQLGYPNRGKSHFLQLLQKQVIFLKSRNNPWQKLGLVGFSALTFGLVVVNESNVDKTLSVRTVQAETLYKDATYSREKLYEFIKQCNFDEPNNIEIMWRLSRASYDLAEEKSTPKELKKSLIYEAYEIIQKALQLSQDNFAVHKWYGIILSSIGDFEGSKVAISNSYLIKEHWEKSAQLNPKDATTRHLLGRWAFNIAGISWIERKIASAIFGSPPQATYEEALEHFLISESITPGFWKKNLLMIAQCYIKLNDKHSAKEWLEKALECPIKTKEDEQVHEEVRMLYSKM